VIGFLHGGRGVKVEGKVSPSGGRWEYWYYDVVHVYHNGLVPLSWVIGYIDKKAYEIGCEGKN